MPHSAASADTIADFCAQFSQSLTEGTFAKLLLSKYRGSDKSLERITIRPIRLKDEPQLSVVYRHKTNDITKNLSYDQAIALVKTWLENDFKSAHLQINTSEIQLEISKKGKVKLSHHNQISARENDKQHDRDKKRFVDINRSFLSQLGVTDSQHKLIPAMSKKWKQINKFVEVFSGALETSNLSSKDNLTVVDFGSGKGYLTFAVHDYLCNTLDKQAEVTGVELREALVKLCNETASQLDHSGLTFVCGDVKTHAPKQTDVMIALHACDTATDYAINYGIQAQAAIIMCSPCCHKQIRPQMTCPEPFKPMLQFGVHLGQQAEMLTDSLRALFLEANGYSCKIFEFISLEHTDKNKMILAVKKKSHDTKDQAEKLAQIASLKNYYGIKEHCLETLLERNL